MIELFKNRKNELHKIAEWHFGNVQARIIQKLNDKIETEGVIERKDFFVQLLADVSLSSDAKFDLLKGKPDELERAKTYYETTFNFKFGLKKNKVFKDTVLKIFFYGSYDDWKAYELAKKLKVEVCPYCNRNYTFVLGKDQENKKFTRFQYDHFFHKAKYPYLALSFYNLVPSCSICNADLKKTTQFELDKNIHPYIEGFGQNAKFTSKPKTYEALLGLDEANLEIKLEVQDFDQGLKKKIEGNVQTFKLNELYAQHGSVISELHRKKHISNDQYLQILQNTFKDFHISKDEMYRLAFGNFMNENDFEKRPLAKLTHDIAEELGLL